MLTLYPELLWLFPVALVIGAAVGFGTWYLGSSRGADQLELANFIGLAALFVVLVTIFAALARAVMLSDLRITVVLIAVLIGCNAGTIAAHRLVPGNSTDGSVALLDPGQLPLISGTGRDFVLADAQYAGPARCDWDSTHTKLIGVTSRRSFALADIPFVTRVSIDLAAGTIAIQRIRPDDNVVVATYAAALAPTADPAGHATLGPVIRTVSPGLDHDTSILIDLLSGLTSWLLFWECPDFA